MKSILSTLMAVFIMASCGPNPRAESERRLADAQQKLEDATRGLQEAQEAAKKESATANPEVKNALEKAQEQVKTSAGNLENASKETKVLAAGEKDKQASDVALRSAAAAELKARQARRLAEPPKIYTVQAGTAITVRTLTMMSTKSSSTGSSFEASLSTPIEVGGHRIAERGAYVEGVVTESDPGGRVKGRAVIGVTLRRLKTSDGRTINIRTQNLVHEARGTKKKDALRIGIGSGIGAAIGAIAGGGKGAAIGAGAGAAAGAGVTLATRGEAAVIPVETLLTFRLSTPFTVEELK